MSDQSEQIATESNGVTILPTTELVGPSGRVIVNTTDVDQWRQRGFQTIAEYQAANAEAPAPAPGE